MLLKAFCLEPNLRKTNRVGGRKKTKSGRNSLLKLQISPTVEVHGEIRCMRVKAGYESSLRDAENVRQAEALLRQAEKFI